MNTKTLVEKKGTFSIVEKTGFSLVKSFRTGETYVYRGLFKIVMKIETFNLRPIFRFAKINQ